eukprot:149273-Prorocentrum_minimum.AAC.3
MSFVQMSFHVTAVSSVISLLGVMLKMELLSTLAFISRYPRILADIACLSISVRPLIPRTLVVAACSCTLHISPRARARLLSPLAHACFSYPRLIVHACCRRSPYPALVPAPHCPCLAPPASFGSRRRDPSTAIRKLDSHVRRASARALFSVWLAECSAAALTDCAAVCGFCFPPKRGTLK